MVYLHVENVCSCIKINVKEVEDIDFKWHKGLRKSKHNRTTACRQGKVDTVNRWTQ